MKGIPFKSSLETGVLPSKWNWKQGINGDNRGQGNKIVNFNFTIIVFHPHPLVGVSSW